MYQRWKDDDIVGILQLRLRDNKIIFVHSALRDEMMILRAIVGRSSPEIVLAGLA